MFRLAYFITFWSERVLRFLGERDQIHALHVAIDIRELFIAKRRFEIAGRAKEQIFSIVTEDRFAGTVPVVGHCGLLFVRERIEINPRQSVFFRTPPCDPLTIRRPIENFDLAPFVLIDLRYRFRSNIDKTQSLQTIAPKQLLAVRRPFRRVVISVGAAG